MVWGIRGWSLKVREERPSTGGRQSGSCYLILLSTLLRFIRQLLGALQYAANGGRIVLRVRPDPAFTLFRLLPYLLVAARLRIPPSPSYIHTCTPVRLILPNTFLFPRDELINRFFNLRTALISIVNIHASPLFKEDEVLRVLAFFLRLSVRRLGNNLTARLGFFMEYFVNLFLTCFT